MKYIILLPFLLANSLVIGQIITFDKKSDVTKVYKGNTVKITADSAYVVSAMRAAYLNDKLEQLDSIQALYNDLTDSRTELLNGLKDTHKTLAKLLSHIKDESVVTSKNITEITNALDYALVSLKNNNKELKKNNTLLKTEIENLEVLVKKLKKETKGLWWNNITDKIVAFAGGVGVGILIAIL